MSDGSPKSGRLAAKDGGTSSALELHDPQHEMHRAIERATNFEEVQKLLDKGETFCRGDGLNCFILAARKWTDNNADSADQHWDLLMKLLQVEPRGILARDKIHPVHGSTLFNHFCKDADKMKQLIELGSNVNFNSGKTLIQSLFSQKLLKSVYMDPRFFFSMEYNTPNFLLLWDVLLEHKEIQNQVTNGDFFQELVLQAKGRCSLASEMFCVLIGKGFMTVEELQAKLKMHPLLFILQLDCEARFALLVYIWSDDYLDKEENVAALGADLNIVDQNGRSLVECIFDPNILGYCDMFETAPYALELWKILIKRSEIQSQASKRGFIRSLLPFVKKSSVVGDIFENIFHQDIWSVEKLTSELQMHPLIFLLKRVKGYPSGFLKVIKLYPSSFFEDKTLLITKDLPVDKNNHARYLSWQKVKKVLNIPDIVNFDVFGYILYNLNLTITYGDHDRAGEEEDNAEMELLFECFTTLLELGFVPSQAAGVVHPTYALLYNIFTKSEMKMIDSSDMGQMESGVLYPVQRNLPNVLKKTMTIFKDFPIPHQLVLDPETGTLILDLHLLMSSMLNPYVMSQWVEKTPLELIMALMQLSPCHPLQHFATFYKYSSCYFAENSHIILLETFCKLLRLTLEASGSHKFQEVDQATINCIRSVCESVEVYQPHEWLPDEEIKLHKKTALKVESEVSSLKWLSILKIRKTLFLNRSSTIVTLPSLIRSLFAEGQLPKGLEAEVLVYKPNNCINF